MCGIYGEFAIDGRIDVHTCLGRLDRLAHRGPDGSGIEVGNFRAGTHRLLHNKEVGDLWGLPEESDYFIGHRRLAIIDLSESASQPMETPDGRFVISFNGEIYNHAELRRELVDSGVAFATDHSDTEVLLLAYTRWGEQCLDRLRGMFAFVIFDRKERSLFFARDPVGEKTLYYRFTPTSFLFASELTALVHGTRDNVIDTTALGSYLTFGYVLHPRSIYVGTKKLLPGCCGTLDLASRHLKTRRYWDLPSEETHAGGGRRDMDWLASVEETLTESVRLRLRSDVPLGAFVSGGIDSAIVAKKVREILGEGPRFELFGADFLGVRGGQAKYMRKVADAYGHQMTNLMVGEEGAVKLGEIMDVLDEPFDGGSAVAVLQLFREAQGRCKVMLTGDGGDELFAGYDLYARFSKLNRWLRMLRRVGPARAGLSAVLRGRPGRVGRLGSFMDESRIGTYVAMVSDFNLLRMLKGGEEDENLREDVGEWARAAEAKGFGDIKMAQYLDFMTTLPGRMLYKVDRFSMHYSIEARVPLLDPDLAKLAFTIPTGVNVTNGGGKAVLKRMLQDDLGADFTERKKEGFGNPLDVWVKGPEAEEAIEVMADRRSRIYEYLDYEIAVESFPQIVSREWKGREQMLWRLVVLQMFLERHGSEIARVA